MMANPADATAIKALRRGEANKDQQARVVDWLFRACAYSEMSYRPNDDAGRESAFAEGKKHVFRQFLTLGDSYLSSDQRRT